jgi:hypothetical protein
MDHSQLKLFDPSGTAGDEAIATKSEKSTVTFARVVGEARVAVSVGDLLPLLAEAWTSKRAWLNDFSADRVIVSQDLYEVVLAYKRLSHTKAA